MSTNPSTMNTTQSTGSTGSGVPPGDMARSDAMSALLARNWGLVMLRGILAVVFGLLAILLPGATLASLVLLFSAFMLVDGVFAIVSAVRAARRNERWGLLVLEGVANIAAGVIAFLWPGITILGFVLIAAAWAIVSGAMMIVSAIRLRRDHGRVWMGLGGLISVIWGVLVAIFPIAGAVVMTIWLGAYAIAFGVALIILALRLRRHSRDAGIEGA